MFNNLLNKIKERKKELAEIEKKINASNVLLDQQKHLFSENVKKIIDSEKKIKELDRQIANREKFWIDTELKYIDNLDGFEFEKYITDLFNKLNYSAVTTKASNDDGVDVIAKKDGIKYAIQCKNYSSPVGNKAVQEVYTAKGITKSDKAIVLTNYPTFTTSAIKEATVLDVELWGRDKLIELLYFTFNFNLRNIDNLNYNYAKSNNSSNNTNADVSEFDPFLFKAIDTIIETGQASTSFIQRRFKIGYARCVRIIDQMEELGVISGYQGSKPREVLLTKEQWEREKMNL